MTPRSCFKASWPVASSSESIPQPKRRATALQTSSQLGSSTSPPCDASTASPRGAASATFEAIAAPDIGSTLATAAGVAASVVAAASPACKVPSPSAAMLLLATAAAATAIPASVAGCSCITTFSGAASSVLSKPEETSSISPSMQPKWLSRGRWQASAMATNERYAPGRAALSGERKRLAASLRSEGGHWAGRASTHPREKLRAEIDGAAASTTETSDRIDSRGACCAPPAELHRYRARATARLASSACSAELKSERVPASSLMRQPSHSSSTSEANDRVEVQNCRSGPTLDSKSNGQRVADSSSTREGAARSAATAAAESSFGPDDVWSAMTKGIASMQAGWIFDGELWVDGSEAAPLRRNESITRLAPSMPPALPSTPATVHSASAP